MQQLKQRPLPLARNDNYGRPSAQVQVDAWLSPMSDHFPTPRGFHFLSAPILPSSPSNDSTEESTSPTTSSTRWNRASVMTDVTEFDDIYDVSDDEPLNRVPSRKLSGSRKSRGDAATARERLTLVIPSSRNLSTEDWSAASFKNKLVSPVPPTPPTRVDMSPEVFSFMQARQRQEIPTISAPPSLDGSLDGSLTSEQLAQLSAPPTPVIGNDDDDVKPEDWSGVQLQPGALETLQALSGDGNLFSERHEQPEQVMEISPEPMPEMRQSGLRIFTQHHTRAAPLIAPSPTTQAHRRSFADLTRLDIPSPGGFFSGLSPRTRSTWHLPSRTPDDMVPPTSTTAEQFYRCPWNTDGSASPVPPVPSVPAVLPVPRIDISKAQALIAENYYRTSTISSSEPVEQVIEVPEIEEEDEDDMPTARPVVAAPLSPTPVAPIIEPSSPIAQDNNEAATEIVAVYDPKYAKKQQEVALANLDRTELWLMAQRIYLKPVETSDDIGRKPPGITTAVKAKEPEKPETQTPKQALEILSQAQAKKTVRFSMIITASNIPRSLPSKLRKHESAYYRAFQDYFVRTCRGDAFVHRLPRFEALQAQRVSLRQYHRNQLLGKYQLSVVPQSAKKRLSANVARGDDVVLDDPEKFRREQEYEAMRQMGMATWHVAAVKMLNGGRLISAPVAKRLNCINRMSPGKDGVARDRARILDLGGQATCDWAWHCALQYPNTKIYTVTTKAIRQLSNSNIRGPPNHRQVAVERLTRLPFEDNQFDLVSARELHSILKYVGENGEDEWENCLRECLRVLKPGGYLEFSLLDSDIMNAGPLGLAKSVEFGFTLKTLGYDPSPTKLWLGRLARAGFDDVRRAWVCLPMGSRRPSHHMGVAPGDRKLLPALPTLRSGPNGEAPRTLTMEAMVTGSTDGVASLTGIVGGWSWERWLLRCEMEKVAGELRLIDTVTAGTAVAEAGKCLDGVAAIVEEGRTCGAGWRMLNGYARKPLPGTGMIPVKVAMT